MIKSDYNLRQTDFDKFAEGLKSAPNIAINVIDRISKYESIKAKTNKERLFWKAVAKGCEASL